MDCPSCVITMNTQVFHNIEIDACNMCGGLWFDKHELAQYIKTRKIPFKFLSGYCLDDRRKIISEGNRKCPRCKNNMQIVTHAGVNVDYCSQCGGLWFDRGELAKILDFYVKQVGDKKKKKPLHQNERPVDEGWEEVIRITEDGIIEETVKPENAMAMKETIEGTIVPGDDPVAKELREGGSMEDIAAAMPEQAKKAKQMMAQQANGIGYYSGKQLHAGLTGTAVASSAGDAGSVIDAGGLVAELAVDFIGMVFDLFD